MKAGEAAKPFMVGSMDVDVYEFRSIDFMIVSVYWLFCLEFDSGAGLLGKDPAEWLFQFV